MPRFFALFGLALVVGGCDSFTEPEATQEPRAPSFDITAEITCGNVFLGSQKEVDAFNCDVVKGFLWLKGADITNVNGLLKLSTVTEWVLIDNTSIIDLDGLASLTSVGDLNINNNPALTNIEGLRALTAVVRCLDIWENPLLTSLDGLENLTTVGGEVAITSLSSLEDIDGLSSLSSVGSHLYLWENDALTNVDGLGALTWVGVHLVILRNGVLGNLDGLAGLEAVGQNLAIEDNDALTDVDGLTALHSVGGNVKIIYNDVLTNLDGLVGLNKVGGDLAVWVNPQLSECTCGLLGLLATGGVGGSVEIGDNATGCESWSEIVEAATDYPECGCSSVASEIADLVADGVLRVGQGVALSTRLGHAMRKAEAGQYKVAQNLAKAFVAQVFDLVKAGVLSAEQASPLIGRVTLLIKIWSEMEAGTDPISILNTGEAFRHPARSGVS